MPYIGNIVQDFSVNNAMLNTDSVTSIKIDDGTIVNADINDSAAIAMSKLALSITNSEINASAAIAVSKLANFVTNNADNRLITGSGTANTLNGEANLTFTGSILTVTNSSGAAELTLVTPSNTDGGVYFNDGSNTGALTYQHSDDSMRFRVNSTEKMRIDSSGNVGIGESASIDARLHVNSGTDNATLFIESTDGDVNLCMADNAGSCRLLQSAGDLHFRTGGNANAFGTGDSERMVIDSSGKVGINETSPLARLHVKNGESNAAGYAHDTVVVEDSDHAFVTLLSGTSGSGGINFGDAGDPQRGVIQYDHGSDYMRFITAAAERMRIDSSGRVMIGTTTAAAFSNRQLSVSSSSGTTSIELRSATNGDGRIIFTDSTSSSDTGSYKCQIKYLQDSDDFIINSNGDNERFRIDSSGNVGIGTTNPDSNKLFVQLTNDNSNAFKVKGGSSQGRTNIALQAGNATSGSITSYRLINSSGTAIGSFHFDNATDDINIFNSSQGGKIFFHTNESGSSLVKMIITDNGRVFIGATNPAAAANADDLCIGNNDGSGETGITLGSNTASGIRFADGNSNSAAVIQYTHGSTNAFQFSAEGAERMRLTGDGPHLLLGGTSDVNEITESSATAGMVIGGTGFGNAGLAIITSTSGTGRLYFGDDVGGNTGRNVGQITYGHSDNHMRFVTASTERMRIDSSGNVGIGSTPLSRLSIVDAVSSGHLMVIRNTQTRANGVRYGIDFRDSSNETNITIVAVQTGSNNQASMEIYANNGSGGNGITGGTSGVKAVTIGPGGLITHKEFGMHDAAGTESAKFLDFGFQGNSCNFRRTNGSDGAHANFITVNSSNVVSGDFNDTSDEKLKKNILSVVDGAIENIKKLRPVTFDWIDETRNNDVSGFVAQEVKEVLPNLIDGTEYDPTLIDETKGSKGGIKSEGYSINTIGLVAHLTKALQEAVAKIETLETKVAALEAA